MRQGFAIRGGSGLEFGVSSVCATSKKKMTGRMAGPRQSRD